MLGAGRQDGYRQRVTATADPATTSPLVLLRELTRRDRDEFLTLVHESRALHQPWVYPPERADQFEDLLARGRRDDFLGLLACRVEDGAIVGVFTISQIVRRSFQSAFLGYYGHARYAGSGYMRAGLRLVLELAFTELRLHRLEANIQPGNSPSIALATGGGFRLEGYSPRYLLIGGQWRDHERYAITAEEWRKRAD
jgi:ribosomal-protein-alanine N-acetyltransferase